MQTQCWKCHHTLDLADLMEGCDVCVACRQVIGEDDAYIDSPVYYEEPGD